MWFTEITSFTDVVYLWRQGYIFWRKLLIYSPSAVKCLISSPSNLNFDVIPPWLDNILNPEPLKCPGMLPNRPDMWQFSDSLTKNKELCKNLKINSSPGLYFFPKYQNVLFIPPGGVYNGIIRKIIQKTFRVKSFNTKMYFWQNFWFLILATIQLLMAVRMICVSYTVPAVFRTYLKTGGVLIRKKLLHSSDLVW